MNNNDNTQTEIFTKLKQKEFEILCLVDDFCKENDIKYSLAFGTMLGAVRHNGFIPWDDDIDIMMDRDNYLKFISAWGKKHHPENLILQNKDTDHDFSQTHTKIRLDHSTFLQPGEENTNYHKGVFIDVFPICSGPVSKLEKISFKLKGLFFLLFARGFVPPKASAPVRIFSKCCLSVVPKSKHYSVYKKLEESIVDKYSEKTRPNYDYSIIEDYSLALPIDLFENFKKINFEQRAFSCIEDTDAFLKAFYGDYMQLPPEEERVWKHSPLIIDFERNYEDIKNGTAD